MLLIPLDITIQRKKLEEPNLKPNHSRETDAGYKLEFFFNRSAHFHREHSFEASPRSGISFSLSLLPSHKSEMYRE